MAVDGLGAFKVTLGGTGLSIVPDPTVKKDDPAGAAAYAGAYLTQESTRQIAKRDVPVYLRRFSKGAGFVERRDADDDGGYAWLENAFGHFGNGLIPSGQQANVGLGLGLSLAGTVVQDSVYFEDDGDLYCLLTNSTTMVKLPDADPSQAFEYSPPLNSFGSPTGSFHPGYQARAIALFATAALDPCIIVSAVHESGSPWRLYQYTTSGGWSASTTTTTQLRDMGTCWWEDKSGVGAERLHVNIGNSTLRHCIQGTDPLDIANYVTPIVVGNAAYDIKKIVTAPSHLYVLKNNGIHDVSALKSWNLTPYWAEQRHTQINHSALVYDNAIYASRGTGVDRYDLAQNGLQQRVPGECGPLAFMQDGTPIRGFITALATHNGWLLAFVYNPTNKTSYLMRGKDRRALGIDIPNPVVWHGAEQVILPQSGAGVDIAHMRVVPAVAADYGDATAMLLMFGRVNGASADPDLYYCPLPNSTGPLATAASGGSFPYHATARYFLTAQNWDDRNAQKGVRVYDLANRNTTATSTLELKSRADGDPTTITDQSTWTSQGTATGDGASIIPTTGVTGRSIATQVVATTPSPYTSPPIFHELSPRARVVRQVFDVRQMWVVLERDYELEHGAPDLRDPDETLAAIVAMQNDPATQAYTDEKGTEYTVYVEQGISYRRIQLDEREYRTVARIELSLVA